MLSSVTQVVSLLETGSCLRLMYYGFTFYASSSLRNRVVFPLSSSSFLSRNRTSSRVGYWYRKHTSQHKAPILLIHGIGIGFYTYGSFLTDLASSTTDDASVGIIALELTSISSRISAPGPSATQLKTEVDSLLDHHGWNKVVLVGHS